MGLKIPSTRAPRLVRSLLALLLALAFLSLYNHTTSSSSSTYYAPLSPVTDAMRWQVQPLESPPSNAIVEQPRSESLQFTMRETPPESNGFAYVFYATDEDYACSVLVNIHQLRYVVKSQYPVHVLVSPFLSNTSISALQNASAIVHVQPVPAMPKGSATYYNGCMLKMLAFKLHLLDPTLKRVLVLDSDQLVLKNLDALFTGIPLVDLAAPRAYWIAKDFISSTFLLITLSDRLWQMINTSLAALPVDFYDMDLINEKFGNVVTMLSGEYITVNSHWEDWNLPNWYHPPDPSRPVHPEHADTESHVRVAVGEIEGKLGHSTDLPTTTTTPSSTTATTAAQTGDMLQDGDPDATKGEIDEDQIDGEVTEGTMDVTLPERPRRKGPEREPSEVDDAEAQRREEIREELYRLYDFASVLHFFAVGKPWHYTAEYADQKAPNAHPLLKEQFGLWNSIADRVCPEVEKFAHFDPWFWIPLSSSSSSPASSSTSTGTATETAATSLPTLLGGEPTSTVLSSSTSTAETTTTRRARAKAQETPATTTTTTTSARQTPTTTTRGRSRAEAENAPRLRPAR